MRLWVLSVCVHIYIYEDKFSLMRVGAYGLQFLSSGFGFTVSVLG